MASIHDHVTSVRGVSEEHISNIIATLYTVGFDVYCKRQGAALRYVDVDSLPYLNDVQRGVLKYAATGKLTGLIYGFAYINPGQAPPAARAMCSSQLLCNLCFVQEFHGAVR